MDETRQVVDALKRCLKMRGLTYRSLAERINLSEASVKRIFSERSFTLRRVEQVCSALEISVGELLRRSRPTTLSLEQEEALARDPALLSFFYLLLHGWTEPDIQRGYEFEEVQIRKARARLIELELIESLPRAGIDCGLVAKFHGGRTVPYVAPTNGRSKPSFSRLISRARQISSAGSPPN